MKFGRGKTSDVPGRQDTINTASVGKSMRSLVASQARQGMLPRTKVPIAGKLLSTMDAKWQQGVYSDLLDNKS